MSASSAASSATDSLPGALNFLQLFLHADIVVQVIMVGLALSSLWSWAIIIQKTGALNRVNKEADGFEGALNSGRALDDIAATLGTQPKEPFQKLLVAVTAAWKDYKGKSMSAVQGDLLVSQVDREMNHIIANEADSIEDGLSILAVIATAMGLFAAIPAYIAFNLFNSRVARFTSRMEGFADELMVSLTRRLGDKLGG